MGIDSHRFNVDFHQDGQFQVAVLGEFFQIRDMLEVVGIQFLIRQGQVRFDIIREFHDLQVDAFLRQLGLDKVQDFRVRDRRGADFQDNFLAVLRRGGFLIAAATAGNQQPGRCQCQGAA